MPRAGLGNKLLVWARAYAFSRLHKLPLYISPWEQVKLGPIVRRERDPRFYNSYFKHGHRMAFFARYWFARYAECQTNPPLDEAAIEPSDRQKVYIFRWDGFNGDYFHGLEKHLDVVRFGLLEMTLQHHLQVVNETPPPCIGIHIRRGDFPELKPHEDFYSAQLTRTPLTYFKDLIEQIRSITNASTEVSIFSDARPAELEMLLRLPNVIYASTNSAVADLLLLSKSKVIALSAGSTFGYWSAFLSNAAIIHNAKNFRRGYRPAEFNKRFFEGPVPNNVTEWPRLLVANLKELTCT